MESIRQFCRAPFPFFLLLPSFLFPIPNSPLPDRIIRMSVASPSAREGTVPAGDAELFFRETGNGQPIVVLHGGPDFDHTYLLPELDRLSDAYRLIYYDQRGRGRSTKGVQPEDVTIQSDVEDLERLRVCFQLETVALLGHSWGGILALEYA